MNNEHFKSKTYFYKNMNYDYEGMINTASM